MWGWMWAALTTTAAMAATAHDQPHVGPRNLVVFNSVGRSSTLHHVAHSLATHFSDRAEWQCVAMVWSGHAALKMALRATSSHRAAPLACVLQVSTGARWGEFLHSLTSAVVAPFEHVAVLLDDLFAPGSGPFAISVPRLLEAMHTHQLGAISPAIIGAHAKPMLRLTGGTRGARACLRHVDGIEIFFAIYTREAWSCMAEALFDLRNVGGCAYGLAPRPWPLRARRFRSPLPAAPPAERQPLPASRPPRQISASKRPPASTLRSPSTTAAPRTTSNGLGRIDG